MQFVPAFNAAVFMAMPIVQPLMHSLVRGQAKVRTKPRASFRQRALTLGAFQLRHTCHGSSGVQSPKKFELSVFLGSGKKCFRSCPVSVTATSNPPGTNQLHKRRPMADVSGSSGFRNKHAFGRGLDPSIQEGSEFSKRSITERSHPCVCATSLG
jgi:hypothetical protein